MTLDEAEKARIAAKAVAEYQKKKDREMRDRLSKAGKVRTPKKRKAQLRNIKIALAVRWGKPRPKE
jgi:hypothetical protein